MSNLVDQIGENLAIEKNKACIKKIIKTFLVITAIGLTPVVYAAGVYAFSSILPSGAIKLFGTIAAIMPGIGGLVTYVLCVNNDVL